MTRIIDWLKCPGCHRTGTVALQLGEKSMTAQCNACGKRTFESFGFGRPVTFGSWNHEY